MRSFAEMFGRVSLFIIYAGFGALKLFGDSPANPLVANLLEKTLPFITFSQFILILGVFEIIIGVLFLIPRFKILPTLLFVIHMVMTTAPLVMLPEIAWQSAWIPTLEGQYIIKNLALISIVLFLWREHKWH